MYHTQRSAARFNIPAGVFILLLSFTTNSAFAVERSAPSLGVEDQSPRRSIPHTNNTAMRLQGPALGYVWDESVHGFRTISGIPGAAVLSDPYLTRGGFTSVAISPGQNLALVVTVKGFLLRVSLPDGTTNVLSGAAASNSQIVLSPEGNSALVYRGDSSQVILVTGLSASPSVRTLNFDIGPIVEAAVSDQGISVFAVKNGGSLTLYSVNEDNSPVAIASGGGGPIAFLHQRDALVITDTAAATLSLVTGLNGAITTQVVATADDGLAAPSAVGISADNNSAWVANGGDSSVVHVSLIQHAATVLPIPVKITQISSLAGNSIFQLSKFGTDPLPILDGDSPTPQVLYIPAPVKKDTTAEVAQ